MEPIITEQIEKFQSGDFSGYESFYYATSQTVYTMLHTIIPDENTAAELMPKVYEKIYANVQTDRKSRRVGKECRSRWSPYH